MRRFDRTFVFVAGATYAATILFWLAVWLVDYKVWSDSASRFWAGASWVAFIVAGQFATAIVGALCAFAHRKNDGVFEREGLPFLMFLTLISVGYIVSLPAIISATWR